MSTDFKTIAPILLAGGTGMRLWPVSRKSYPKQFSKFIDKKHSFFQKTLLRLLQMKKLKVLDPIIFTLEEYRFIVQEQLDEIGVTAEAIFLEPSSKNTAPTVLCSILNLDDKDYSGNVLIIPTDHSVIDEKEFSKCIEVALKNVNDGEVITFGVKPNRIETGYGYLKVKGSNHSEIYEVESFVEKPDERTAADMISSGKFLWNSGIFFSNVKTLKRLFIKHASYLIEPIERSLQLSLNDLSFIRLDGAQWEKCASISIDYAIMEKSTKLKSVALNAGWSDMGNWGSILRESEKDDQGCFISGNVMAESCSGSLLVSNSQDLEMLALGLKNLVVVSSNDAVLIADRERTNDIKPLLDALKKKGVNQAENFKKNYRPWGTYETLIKEENYHVKIIEVNPFARLSLQSHKYRSEHWVVVEGVADVFVNGKEMRLNKNESTYIQKGTKHRLHNANSKLLKIIEVQTGNYLEEDDIIRYEDDYARV